LAPIVSQISIPQVDIVVNIDSRIIAQLSVPRSAAEMMTPATPSAAASLTEARPP
jgi:hypothetical protein